MAKEMTEDRVSQARFLVFEACDHCKTPWQFLMAKTPTWGRGKGRRRGGGNVVKTRRIVKVRDLAIQLLRGATPKFSFPEIARILSMKHHTGPMLAFRRAGNVPLTVEELEKTAGKARLLVFVGSAKCGGNQPWIVQDGVKS